MTVSPDELGNAIIKELNKYTYEVEQKVADAVVDVGKKSAKELKRTKQVVGSKGKSSKTWVKYPKGWTVKKVKRKGKQIAEVHNKTAYQLTHLLENGHVIKNGTGRTYDRTQAFKHIKPIEVASIEELDGLIREAIEG